MLFSSLVIGSVDNVLRPILVGRDTKMHELMIFFSTLGGLLVFRRESSAAVGSSSTSSSGASRMKPRASASFCH